MLELAFQIIDVMTGKVLDTFHTLIKINAKEWACHDPESLKIHGISFDEMQQGASEKEVALAVTYLFSKHKIQRGKAVFICQNPSFDRAFFSQLIAPEKQEELNWPYHWLDLASMFWSMQILHHKLHASSLPWETGLSKDKIAAVYHLKSETKPHRASNGVEHLIACYKAVVGFPTKIGPVEQ